MGSERQKPTHLRRHLLWLLDWEERRAHGGDAGFGDYDPSRDRDCVAEIALMDRGMNYAGAPSSILVFIERKYCGGRVVVL
jgi:hypothetical protein